VQKARERRAIMSKGEQDGEDTRSALSVSLEVLLQQLRQKQTEVDALTEKIERLKGRDSSSHL
jgi:hypothetical protein